MNSNTRLVHEGHAYNKDVIAMTMPLLLMSFFFYGPRPIFMAVVAVIVAWICDRVASMLRAQRYDKTENSSTVIALVIVLMMPATARYSMVVVAVLVAVLVAKEAFGGYKSYPFNPAAVGFCTAAVCWPEEIFRYPQPKSWLVNLPQGWEELWKMWRFEDATLVEGASYTLKSGAMPNIDLIDLLLGNFSGPLGVTCCLVIVACGVFLVVRKRLSLVAPLAFLGTAAIIAFVFPRYNGITFQSWPVDILLRLEQVKFELLASAMLFAAIFLVDEPGTLPRTNRSRLLYGALLGFATMMFRYFGTFEMGACFALLLVNAIYGFFDRAIERNMLRRKGAMPE